jgi:hypothetical protein
VGPAAQGAADGIVRLEAAYVPEGHRLFRGSGTLKALETDSSGARPRGGGDLAPVDNLPRASTSAGATHGQAVLSEQQMGANRAR